MCQNKAALPCVISLSCVSWAAHGKKSLCCVPDFMHTTNTWAQMLRHTQISYFRQCTKTKCLSRLVKCSSNSECEHYCRCCHQLINLTGISLCVDLLQPSGNAITFFTNSYPCHLFILFCAANISAKIMK